MRLDMQRARGGRASDEIDNLGMLGVAHVERGDAVAEAVTDIGIAALHHDLNAVGMPVHIRMADEFDIAGRQGIHFTASR